MDKKQRDTAFEESEKDDLPPKAACTGSASSGRSADGRFVSPHSGNPKGRPPKPKISAKEQHNARLLRELDNALLGENPLKQEVFAGLNMEQSMFKSACLQGLKSYKAFLALLKLREKLANARLFEDATDEAEANDLDALELFVERELRRERLSREDPKYTDEDDCTDKDDCS